MPEAGQFVCVDGTGLVEVTGVLFGAGVFWLVLCAVAVEPTVVFGPGELLCPQAASKQSRQIKQVRNNNKGKEAVNRCLSCCFMKTSRVFDLYSKR